MTDMPEKIWASPDPDYMNDEPPCVLLAELQKYGYPDECEYVRADTIQALRESHDRLLMALKCSDTLLTVSLKNYGYKKHELSAQITEAIAAAEKLQEGR